MAARDVGTAPPTVPAGTSGTTPAETPATAESAETVANVEAETPNEDDGALTPPAGTSGTTPAETPATATAIDGDNTVRRRETVGARVTAPADTSWTATVKGSKSIFDDTEEVVEVPIAPLPPPLMMSPVAGIEASNDRELHGGRRTGMDSGNNEAPPPGAPPPPPPPPGAPPPPTAQPVVPPAQPVAPVASPPAGFWQSPGLAKDHLVQNWILPLLSLHIPTDTDDNKMPNIIQTHSNFRGIDKNRLTCIGKDNIYLAIVDSGNDNGNVVGGKLAGMVTSFEVLPEGSDVSGSVLMKSVREIPTSKHYIATPTNADILYNGIKWVNKDSTIPPPSELRTKHPEVTDACHYYFKEYTNELGMISFYKGGTTDNTEVDIVTFIEEHKWKGVDQEAWSDCYPKPSDDAPAHRLRQFLFHHVPIQTNILFHFSDGLHRFFGFDISVSNAPPLPNFDAHSKAFIDKLDGEEDSMERMAIRGRVKSDVMLDFIIPSTIDEKLCSKMREISMEYQESSGRLQRHNLAQYLKSVIYDVQHHPDWVGFLLKTNNEDGMTQRWSEIGQSIT
jgi:hypothetical protein